MLGLHDDNISYAMARGSRFAMYHGRSCSAAYGAPSAFSTLLYTKNAFDLGYGVMLPFEP